MRFLKRIALVLGAMVVADPAFAQFTTGTLFGKAVDPATGMPVSGVTVIATGPQGDQATLTEADGSFQLAALPVGDYLVQFYAPDSAEPVTVPGVVVAAGQSLRVDGAVSGQMTPSETMVITRRASSIDLGTARTGLTLQSETLMNLPLDRTYGGVLSLAPGAFFDASGNVSVMGASGLENVYMVDGLNVTGIEYGSVMSTRDAKSRGGTNLVLEFLDEVSVNTGGYAAEYGGAMGGVVNTVTKSGSNTWKGSVFGMWTPGGLYGTPRFETRKGSSLSGRSEFGNELNIGFEVGGPIIKNRLFIWAGFAPRLESSTFRRNINGLVDANGDGMADVDANMDPLYQRIGTNLLDEYRRTYTMGTKITFVPEETSRLNLSVFSTPTRAQSVYVQNAVINPASQHPDSALTEFARDNTDVQLSGTKHLFDRSWRIDALLGWHNERFKQDSPYSNINNTNSIEHFGASLFDLEGIAGCQPRMVGGQMFDPCPVDAYHGGGIGAMERSRGNRYQADLKSTNLFSLGGRHEVKYGLRAELNEMTLNRRFSGPPGARNAIQSYHPGAVLEWNLFTLPEGAYPFQFANDASPLTQPPYYKDELSATVKNHSYAAFIQDSYSPVANLNLNVGLRYERQKLYDFRNSPFASFDNLGLRAGAIYDPTHEGRAKLYTHYGRFFETVPLNLAARYFGGEGIAINVYDGASCPTPPSQWTGSGNEADACSRIQTAQMNNGSNYPVQPNLRGQFHDELVAGGQWEPLEDLTLGVNLTHRWLGNVIEDGATRDHFTFVLANPGNIRQEALDKADQELAAKEIELQNATTDADRARLGAEVGNLKARSETLQDLAKAPKPKRTYTGVTFNVARRFAQNFMVNAQYTYARLTGNYNGLFDPDNSYAAPNGSNAYDTPDLVLNRSGALANDRPHSFRLMGHSQFDLGPGKLLGGLVFNAYSGVPRNYMSNLGGFGQLVFLLPRGSAGRTPTVTQVDAKLSYRQAVGKDLSLELFVDLFNILNTRTALLMDDNYTFESVAPIVGGTKDDLKVARTADGNPVQVNPNFGNGRVFQVPFHGRMGLRLMF